MIVSAATWIVISGSRIAIVLRHRWATRSLARWSPEPKPPKEVIDAEFSEIQAEQVEDIYDSEILADMIKQMEDGLALMADRWKVSQPWTYKKYRMAVEAYKMYQAAHD